MKVRKIAVESAQQMQIIARAAASRGAGSSRLTVLMKSDRNERLKAPPRFQVHSPTAQKAQFARGES